MTRCPVLFSLAGLSFSVALVAVALAYADLREVGTLFKSADKGLVAIIGSLAVLDHLIRFARWHLLVHVVEQAQPVLVGSSPTVPAPPAHKSPEISVPAAYTPPVASPRDARRNRKHLLRSLTAYLAGGPLIFTPARAGEVVRSVFARRLIGVSVARTVPILLAERVADIGVMALLAAIGLVAAGRLAGNWPPLAGALALLLAMLAGILALTRLGSGIWDRWRLSRNALAASALEVRQSGLALITPRSIAIVVGLGLAAWGVEVAIYALAVEAIATVEAVGAAPGATPLAIAALAIFPLASLIGALSLVPAGLGATEGSLTGLGVALAGLTVEASLAAGVIARAAILLVVVALGLPALAVVIALWRLHSAKQSAPRGSH